MTRSSTRLTSASNGCTVSVMAAADPLFGVMPLAATGFRDWRVGVQRRAQACCSSLGPRSLDAGGSNAEPRRRRGRHSGPRGGSPQGRRGGKLRQANAVAVRRRPFLIVKVLSENTWREDIRPKLQRYNRLRSVHGIWLIDSRERWGAGLAQGGGCLPGILQRGWG